MWSGIFNFNTFWIILILNKKKISPGRRGFPHIHPIQLFLSFSNMPRSLRISQLFTHKTPKYMAAAGQNACKAKMLVPENFLFFRTSQPKLLTYH